jgi:hypothetical protein
MITQEIAKELFSYDPETGELVWKKSTGPKPIAGRVVACDARTGYMRVQIFNKDYLAHRVIWLYVHGEWPDGFIDHINGKRNDNRLVNLRVVSVAENARNQRKAQKSNSTGFLGVSRYYKGRFRASICKDKKVKQLGIFNTPEEAHQAYLEAKRELHSTCSI